MAVDSGYGSPKPKRRGYTDKKSDKKKSPVIGEGAGTGPRRKPIPGLKNPKPTGPVKRVTLPGLKKPKPGIPGVPTPKPGNNEKRYKPPFIRARG